MVRWLLRSLSGEVIDAGGRVPGARGCCRGLAVGNSPADRRLRLVGSSVVGRLGERDWSARGFEELLAGIHLIARGDSLLSPSVTRRLIASFVRDHPRKPQPPPGLDELTPREFEILQLVARGLSNAEIAEQLVVSTTTIKSHVARVLDKLGLRDRVQAVVLAYETGVIRPGTEP